MKKIFTLGKHGAKTLSHETIKQYDAKGNLTTEISKTDNYILFKKTNKYDSKGHVIKIILIFKKNDYNPNEYILDSSATHYDDKKQYQYDTTISTKEYDMSGNEIRAVIFDTNGIVEKTSTTEYSGNEKIFSFDITPQGDTTAKFVFNHDRKFTKQVGEIKELKSG